MPRGSCTASGARGGRTGWGGMGASVAEDGVHEEQEQAGIAGRSRDGRVTCGGSGSAMGWSVFGDEKLSMRLWCCMQSADARTVQGVWLGCQSASACRAAFWTRRAREADPGTLPCAVRAAHHRHAPAARRACFFVHRRARAQQAQQLCLSCVCHRWLLHQALVHA